ncbi:MAG TPA: bifunctional 4-hydroxy-2-oxoglutarate aldolase/2-dehydro-3-deoxy-phosphogluconate aldolase [Paracoccus sp. (in: a-proteobacteria)]|nr:bifunctional 4-hydroxy-2-oxoglutarate aldolase/2-dehydro-3-deoxy-phosphogluconate aldolase [Paracoccus sp. (in: a-proteobacteria)]
MTPASQSGRTRVLCGCIPVIPVLTLRDAAWAEPLARTLAAAGLSVLEVTLRSDAALPAIRAMAQVPGVQIGAGTVLTPEDAFRAREAGATFAVSPGLTDRLISACEDAALPLLPGVATASEAMIAAEHGFDMLKFFPAEPAGGVPLLKALHGPLPHLAFCPTGGIGPHNARSYLALPNVSCVGGSWIAPEPLMARGDWDAIGTLARDAAELAA